MCHRLFIASDAFLPEVEPTRVPSISIERVGDAQLLPFPRGWTVVEAGSTSGCACDFHGKRSAARSLLAEYLRSLCGRQALRVFSTWYGDEAQQPIRHQTIRWAQITDPGDPFPLQTITEICPQGADHV